MLAADLGNVAWRKSSHSGQGGNCVEVADLLPASVCGLYWRKSSFSGAQSNCVEMAVGAIGAVPVRDSKDPDGPALLFAAEAWSSFLAGVKSGDFPTD
ncbi:DUF397 domain-containing protein [Streptomyces sp. CB01881]|uniref:DUF397 domain-containing protein n=1 Tax=Streptomyces sp. CB01881 TaxID=2078691 RepID=UPI000CDBF807|nr:DUF397 domain-containing protein [Streptomyces sp. CB01881]AUY49890.1 DUF397 domain-containing protein [Streptomyces sp. CB01881]TYC73285.1 DUF397 domain-containing protein [Streptomyces sp. CB01881]